MNALHLQAIDIIPTIPEAMMGDVIDYLSAARDMGEKNCAEEKELDLSGLPKSVNADKMTDEELTALLKKGIEEALAGKGEPFDEFERKFRAKHNI